uniref:Uncharacterized protein n=1 Tax=Vitis vinifera TaxID=29760 RepID=A5BAK0_VITVI|nr:hypothetical protein VITISV_019862 [Vitis vinifera]
MEIIQKYLKKRSKRVGAKISGSSRNISQVKNGVCEISQTLKRAAKLLRSKRLVPHRCEVGFHLVVFGFHRGVYRATSGGNPQHCTKRLRNSRNKRLIPQHFRVIDLQWL